MTSYRGPLVFERTTSGAIDARRGPGGVVSAIAPVAAEQGATWVAAATDDLARSADAARVARGQYNVVPVPVETEVHYEHYEVFSNPFLWFVLHGMYDGALAPVLTERMNSAWDAYVSVNTAFAEAIAEEAATNDLVLVQDYHLMLVPELLRALRRDLRVAFFLHTPFCWPNEWEIVPERFRRRIGASLGSVPSGFHTARWELAFRLSTGTAAGTYVSSLSPDIEIVRSEAARPDVAVELSRLEEDAQDRHVIARVDRLDLTKNIVRGFLAYEYLLATNPQWHERVVFVASCVPSRSAIPEYARYADDVREVVERVNERYGTADWQPIRYYINDNISRSMALLRRYDVLLVNPIRDGMNFVAKEGAVVNERSGVIVLTRGAGAFDDLESGIVEADAPDIVGTAGALKHALEMDSEERRHRSRALLGSVGRWRVPKAWLADQVAAAN